MAMAWTTLQMESKVVGCEKTTIMIKSGLAMQNLALPCMIMISKDMHVGTAAARQQQPQDHLGD